MEKLPKDMILLLALELDMKTLLDFCSTSKKLNEMICKNDVFWRNRLEKERPGLIAYLYTRNGKLETSYKELYMFLEETKNRYTVDWQSKPLTVFGVVKGGYYDVIEKVTDKKNLLGEKVWVVVSNEEYNFPPSMYETKEEASQFIIERINELLIDEYEIYNEHPLEYYIEKLNKNNFVKINQLEFLLKEVIVI